MDHTSPFPPRRPKPRKGILSFLWGIVWGIIAGLFDIRWLLGMPPKHVTLPAPEGATVTVLIPAHNEELHLREAVESLLLQTYRLFSIIVVDDGSTDRTGAIADALAEEYPGLVYAVHTSGTGSKSGALNAGLASGYPYGEFTIVMDADTVFAPDAIEKMLPYFYDPAVAVVCGHVLPKPPQGGKATMWWRSKLVEYILGQGITKMAQNAMGAIVVSSGCFSMYATSLIGRFSDATMAEDMEATWDLQIDGYTAVYAPQSHCYAAEPETFQVFVRQRWRWFCGFLQCYERRMGMVLRRNLRLAIVVHYMFAIALTDIILLPLCIYTLRKNPAFAVIFPSLLDISVMTLALLCYAYCRGGVRLAWQSLCSMPAALVGILVVRYLFLFAIASEWFMKKRLTRWAAGH